MYYPSNLLIKNGNIWTINLPSIIDSYNVVSLVTAYNAKLVQQSIYYDKPYSTDTNINMIINVPSSIKSIYAYAFRNLSSSNSNIVNLSEGLLTLGIRTFSGLKMDSLIIPSTITYIYDYAFEYTNLKNIYYAGNVNITKVFWGNAFISIRTSSTLPYPTLYITEQCRINSGLTFGQLWNNIYIQPYVVPTSISLAEHFETSNKNESKINKLIIIFMVLLISIIIYYCFINNHIKLII